MSIELGKYNTLEVVKEVAFGMYLDGGEEQAALEDICLRSNPRTASLEQIVGLYAAAQ